MKKSQKMLKYLFMEIINFDKYCTYIDMVKMYGTTPCCEQLCRFLYTRNPHMKRLICLLLLSWHTV